MASDALPHVYPFRLVDTVLRARNADFSAGTVGVRVSANGRAAMGEGWVSPALLAEAIAQAALLLEGGDPEIGRGGYLAGIESLEAKRAPRAGETLEIDLRLASRFGAIVKFEGVVRSGEETIARGGILVRKGSGPAER
jgi:3-hydroxymyristoyl/3-hydroxydecanoyl-(acyl carrier protein) dehydratase